ncbi:MOSC domain-containing protein [Chloroflexota bacterium]
MARIIAVCRSDSKGIKKEDMGTGIFRENYGLIDDAHADYATHRQVSLLAMESINKMQNLGFNVGPGDFAENLTTEGITLHLLPIGTEVSIGREAVLTISQIGKECHTGCAIFQQIGKCIMPKEGVFASVLRGGTITVGDEIRIQKDGE